MIIKCVFGLLCWLGILLSGHIAVADEGCLLATDGHAQLPIVTTGPDRPSAQALAKYLEQISGATFTVRTTATPPTTPAILVGKFGATDADGLPGDSFVVRCNANGVQLFGRTSRATAMAVYGFLEKELGCQWWSWNEEDVPKQQQLRIPHLDRVQRAVFLQTDMRNNEAYHEKSGFVYKCRARSTDVQTSSHAMHRHLAVYGKKHPEIYPYSKKKKKRSHNKIHHCYTHPGIAEVIAKQLEKEIRKRGGNLRDVIYMSGMGDWYGGMCECDTCEAIYVEETWTRPDGREMKGYSGTLLRLINQVAEILEAKYPGVRVGTSAYMSLEAPPGKTRPRDNVHIRVPHLRHCIIHGVAACAKNRKFNYNIERWAELAPGRVYIWDYTVNFGENFLHPFPVVRAISDSIKRYADLGIAGMTLQGNYVSTGSDLVVLKNYVWRHLLWDPSLDPDRLVERFCRGYYGPAADAMIQYVTILEDAANGQSKVHLDEFAELHDSRKLFLTTEITRELRARLEAARDAVGVREPYARRVAEVEVSLQAANLFYIKSLVEHEGQLCQVRRKGPLYTYDQAVAMLANSRECSFKEWRAFRSYHPPFLAKHGGPLIPLKRGPLAVKVAPAMGLQLWQILYKGRPLLRGADDPEAEGFPFTGGAFEQTNPHWVTGTVKRADDRSLTMQSRIESGSSVKCHAEKQVELLDDGVIRITVSAHTLTKRDGYQRIRSQNAGVVYQIGKGESCLVEIQHADGQWGTIVFPEQPPGRPAKRRKVNGKWKVIRKAVTHPVEVKVDKPFAALRVTLPDCRIVERYREPGVAIQSGAFVLDRRAGWLRTSVGTKSRTMDTRRMTPWLIRELQVTEASTQ